jgi:hypothetical protein
MLFTRAFLLATGVLFLAFGIAYLVAPVPTASLAALELSTPLAVIEVRGFYGGQLIGLGGLILLGGRRPRFVVPALLVVVASLGGTAAGRIVGVLSTGSLPPIIIAALVVEIGGAVVAGVLMNRESTQIA